MKTMDTKTLREGEDMKFSCCIEMIFLKEPFLERFKKAKRAGFDFVEFWDWPGKNIDAIERAAEEAQIGIASFQGSIRGVMVDRNDRDM